MRWSDPATWGGHKPSAGENVTIPAGMNVLLDENPPSLGGITVEGTLEFDRKDLTLEAKWILVHGQLAIGSTFLPFEQKARLVLTGTDPAESVMGMGTRGILVMGGTLELHGKAPARRWTKISEHAAKGTKTIKLTEEVDWKAGDEIAIAPTDYYRAGNGISITQRVGIASLNGSQLNLVDELNAFRWGLLQFPSTTGMSLSPENRVVPLVADNGLKKTPLVLDERAEVGNLTRNIVIEAPNDNLWTTQGFGVHTMIMGPTSTAHVEGVEIKRGGQRGRLARYAFHWHQLSYAGTQTLGDATGQYFRNSSINSSANRGVVMHGTNGVLIKDNVIFDVKGHGIFTEDAVERRNTIDGNLVLHVRNSTQPLKVHEGAGGAERGSSGFWISNPDNIVTNNVAADCHSVGFWLPFPSQPWGLNNSVLDTRSGRLLTPNRLLFGVFDNNTAHSNGLEGILLDDVEIDNEGNTLAKQYFSTVDGKDPVWPNTTLRRFKLTNYSVWKNGDNGIWDRSAWPDNYGVVSADNCGRFFAGSGADGVIEHSLIVGTSLNHQMNGTDRPTWADFATSNPAAFATYHSSFDIRNNIVIGFPAAQAIRSGVFSTDDYYIRPVEKGQKRNSNNLILESHPGVKLSPAAPYNWFVLASAIWDPHGTWGPKENYFVYDTPFLTYGKTPVIINPGTAISGGVSVPGPFYGFDGFVLHGVGDTPPQNQPYMDLMGIHVKRMDQNMVERGSWTIQPAPSRDALLQQMRHFATSPDGIYELTFPQETFHPTDFQVTVENMLTQADTQVIGIQYDGTKTPVVRLYAHSALFFNYTAVQSLQQVMASAGETFWQDKEHNRVWVKLRGGRWQFWTNNPNEDLPSDDELLYESSILRIFQP